MAALVDVNVLVALMHARHVHCAAAVRWLAGLEDRSAVAICRVSQMGALRILTDPSAMKDDVESAAEFWSGWDRLIDDERFALVGEPARLQDAWRTLSAALPKGTRADYLAKFEALIEAYNSGSRNIEEIFKDLIALAGVLT